MTSKTTSPEIPEQQTTGATVTTVGNVSQMRIDPEPLGPCPPIPLEQIRWRVDSKPSGERARFISYIDARVVGEALDAWVGPLGWDATFEEGNVNGNPVMWCHLTIRQGDRSVVRSDLATFSEGRGDDKAKRVETGVKGLVSGAFKRAAAQAGVGRNVYSLPEVWAPVRVHNGRGYPNDQTTPAILHELAKQGFEPDGTIGVDSDDVDDTPAEEAAATPEAETAVDWTNAVKDAIFQAAEKDATAAQAAYAEALVLTEVTEPILDEAQANMVIAAGTGWLGTTVEEEPEQGALPTDG